MGIVKEYNPKEVTVIVGGKIMHGFADNEFVKVMRNEQGFNLKVGVDGEGTRAKSNNKSGKVEITLMQSSSSNDDLSVFAQLDELNGDGVVPVLIKDNLGRTVVTALSTWIQKIPDIGFAKETGTRTWTLESDEIIMIVGGN